MLRASIGFFIFGILAYILGANNVGGLSIEVGRILLGAFLFLAVLGILVAFVIGKKTKLLP
ncbi:MAG: DUF1328 domain-containing protein [Bdellovibrionia bacterium]